MWTRSERAISVPAEVRQVLSELVRAGHTAYLVGGCVRDAIRGQPVKDYDVATSARPEEVISIFPRVIEVGRAFGVLRVQTGAETVKEVEVATFRTESDYQDRRHPSKVEFSTVEGDASRRDFTVNALYYDVKNGQVLDLFGGLADLNKKLIRAIGNPKDRFEEDALRLLRAVRFAARFGFQVEEKTREAIMECAPLIREVSIERVRDEIFKMMVSPSARQALVEMESLRLFENVLPEIAVGKLDQRKVWDQTLRVMTQLPLFAGATPACEAREPEAFYWAALYLPTLRLYAIEKRDGEARKIAARLKLSNEVADQFAYLARETPKFREAFSMREATLLRWMREKDFPLLMRFHELDAVSYDGNLAGLEFVKSIYPEAQRRFSMKPLLTGDDLVKLGMSPGRQFTEILRTVEDMALEGKLATTEQALEFVLKQFVK